MSGLVSKGARSISRLNQNKYFAEAHTTREGCGIAFFGFLANFGNTFAFLFGFVRILAF
jgi:hypothetical protein